MTNLQYPHTGCDEEHCETALHFYPKFKELEDQYKPTRRVGAIYDALIAKAYEARKECPYYRGDAPLIAHQFCNEWEGCVNATMLLGEYLDPNFDYILTSGEKEQNTVEWHITFTVQHILRDYVDQLIRECPTTRKGDM